MATAVLLVLVLCGLLWGQPRPASSDPVHWLNSTAQRPAELVGRIVNDVWRFEGGCSALLDVKWLEGGPVKRRTELQLAACSAPLLQGWRVQAIGVQRRPLLAEHPLLP